MMSNKAKSTLSIAVCLTFASTVFTNVSPAVFAEEAQQIEFKSYYGTSTIGDVYPYDVPLYNESSVISGIELLGAVPLPESYNSYEEGNLPSVRNQGQEGACWAFGALGALEADLIKNHGASSSSIDLSELQIAYYSTHNYTDPKNCHNADTRSFSSTTSQWLSSGGSPLMAYRAMFNGVGPIAEHIMPYVTGSALNTFQPAPDTALSYKAAHLNNVYCISLQQTEDVKKAIMNYGAVTTSIYSSSNLNNSYGRSSANGYAYNCNTNNTANHAVVLVGWDDNYSKDNFSNQSKPSANGAWLVRNSWGENRYDYRGYFWVSYEDLSLGGEDRAVYVFDGDYNEYDNVYSYVGNGVGLAYRSTEPKITKVVVAYNVKAGESISAIGYETKDTSYTVNAVVSAGNQSVTGSKQITYSGAYTIPLDNVLNINADTDVTVELSFSKGVDIIVEGPGSSIPCSMGGTLSWTNRRNSFYYEGQTKKNGFLVYAGDMNAQISDDDPAVRLYTNNITNTVSVMGVTLSETSCNIDLGSTRSLSATVLPSNATDKTVRWVSNNTAVATVNSNGVVTGVSEGSTDIVAITNDGNKSASCHVTVSPVHVESISLSITSYNMNPGDTVTIVPTVLPENATNKNVTWYSTNESAATVDSNGYVTAVGGGGTYIVATTEDGQEQAMCEITVTVPVVRVTGISIDKTSVTMDLATYEWLNVSVYPSNATNRNYSLESSDISVAFIDGGGRITATGYGEAIITATSSDGGFTATCRVKVGFPVSSVTLSSSTKRLTVGEMDLLTATVLPTNAHITAVTWSSSNSNIVSVDRSGYIEAKAAGTAVITATSVDGGKRGSCTVTVDPAPNSGNGSGGNGGNTSGGNTSGGNNNTSGGNNNTSGGNNGGSSNTGGSNNTSGGNNNTSGGNNNTSGGNNSSTSGNTSGKNNGGSSNAGGGNNTSGGNNSSTGGNTSGKNNGGSSNTGGGNNSSGGNNNTSGGNNNTSGGNNNGGSSNTNTGGNNNTSGGNNNGGSSNTNTGGNNNASGGNTSGNNGSSTEGNNNSSAGESSSESTNTSDSGESSNVSKKWFEDQSFFIELDDYRRTLIPDGYEDFSGSPMIIEGKDLSWFNTESKSYWYEHGVKQGTYFDGSAVLGDGSVRGREICDPETDGWYWLDACYDGAKAVGKEVWMPYIYQNEDSWDDETKRNIAYESDEGMGECVLNAINSKAGKWVRYDENGRMLKGWVTIEGTLAELYPNQAGNIYYYDNRTGLMAKGWVTIGGNVYFFDEMTGALVP